MLNALQHAPAVESCSCNGNAGNDPVICLQDVSFAYDRQPVLTGVNVHVMANELVCVVGPNGGGKSTLLKLILGAIEPTAGRVRVLGDSPARVRKRIGYMPQSLQYDSQFPVTARDVVLMGRLGDRWGGRYSRVDRQAADEAMAIVDVGSLASHSFSTLSGGQRQRVLIARAMACRPELLLLDEPMANVDAAVEAALFETLAHLNRRTTIVMVSHDLKFVSSKVSHVICVNNKVAVHPTGLVDVDTIRELYGSDLRMIRHDHDHAPREHRHHG